MQKYKYLRNATNFSNFAAMTEQTLLEELDIRFSEFIAKRGLRRTAERFAILERVCKIKAHFEVDDLYRQMEEDGFHVSRATVYNTVGLLCQCGILRRLLFDGLQARYELASGNHLHLVCTSCGSIREVDDPGAIASIERMRFPRFAATNFSATVYGKCLKCQRKQRNQKKQINSKQHKE